MQRRLKHKHLITRTLTHPTAKYRAEDLALAGVLQLSKGEVIEVPSESSGDWIATTTGWTHGTHKVHVD